MAAVAGRKLSTTGNEIGKTRSGQDLGVTQQQQVAQPRKSSSLITVNSSFPLPVDEMHMKIMMVGDTAVGKTSIVKRIVDDSFTYQVRMSTNLTSDFPLH